MKTESALTTCRDILVFVIRVIRLTRPEQSVSVSNSRNLFEKSENLEKSLFQILTSVRPTCTTVLHLLNVATPTVVSNVTAQKALLWKMKFVLISTSASEFLTLVKFKSLILKDTSYTIQNEK